MRKSVEQMKRVWALIVPGSASFLCVLLWFYVLRPDLLRRSSFLLLGCLLIRAGAVAVAVAVAVASVRACAPWPWKGQGLIYIYQH